VEEEVGHEPAVHVAGGGQVGALAGSHADGDGLVGAALDQGLVGLVDNGGDLVDAGVEVGEGLHVVLEGLGFGAAEAGDGLLGGLRFRLAFGCYCLIWWWCRTFVTT